MNNAHDINIFKVPSHDIRLLQQLFFLYGKKDFSKLEKLYHELETKCESLLNEMTEKVATLDKKSTGYSPNGEILKALERIKFHLENEDKGMIDLELLKARKNIASEFEKESLIGDDIENIYIVSSLYLNTLDLFHSQMSDDYRTVPLSFLEITNRTIEYLLLFKEHISESYKVVKEQKEKSIFLFNKISSQI